MDGRECIRGKEGSRGKRGERKRERDRAMRDITGGIRFHQTFHSSKLPIDSLIYQFTDSSLTG